MSTTSFGRRHVPMAVVALGLSLASVGTAVAGGSHPPVTKKKPPAPCVKGVGTACTTDVAIAKAADRTTYTAGDTITYTITVTNTGEAPVARERIVVTDPHLADLAPTAPLTGWLPRGGSVVFTGTRTLTAADCGTVSNTATVALAPKPGRADVNPTNDTATVDVTVGGDACALAVVPPPAAVAQLSPAVVTPPPAAAKAAPPVCPRPLLRASLHGAKTAVAGQIVVFRVRVHASGSTARKVRVRVVLPSGFSLAGSGNARRLRGGELVLGVGTLARGATRTIPVALRLDSGVAGRRTLKAAVTATCAAAATATTTLHAAAVLPARVQPAVTG